MAKRTIIFNTPAEFVEALLKCFELGVKYNNKYPYNMLYKHSSKNITADCWNLLKALFNGANVYKLQKGPNPTNWGWNTGDGDVRSLCEQCQYISGDFKFHIDKPNTVYNGMGLKWDTYPKIGRPEILGMPDHAGAYLGTEIKRKAPDGNVYTYNVIECTSNTTNDWGRGGVILTWVNPDGRRMNHKGGRDLWVNNAGNHPWTYHSPANPWVKYSSSSIDVSTNKSTDTGTSSSKKSSTKTPASKKFTIRQALTRLPSHSPFYNQKGFTVQKGYYNTCGTAAGVGSNRIDPNNNVLCNCVGYAQGRALEIFCELKGYNPAKEKKHPFTTLNGMPDQWISRAKNAGLKVSKTPAPGAIVVWSTHVAVVEKIDYTSDGKIKGLWTSDSGWPNGWGGKDIGYNYRTPAANWADWGEGSFLGFIINPAVGVGSTHGGGGGSFSLSDLLDLLPESKKPKINSKPLTEEQLAEIQEHLTDYKLVYKYEDITTTKTFQGLVTAEGDIRRTQGAKLLSYPSLVEAPFVILKVGDYSFGTYEKSGKLSSKLNVQYPNFIDSLRIQKVNGTVNQYTIKLVYQIEAGNDPNFVDKIFSKVGYGMVYISYGDWMCPTFIYSEEEALITNVKSEVDFSSSRITYTVSCTSNSIALASTTFNFPMRKAKPSDIIISMLKDNQYGLSNLFTGMRNMTQVMSRGLLATNDKVVEIPSKEGIDPLTYLNYLVSCMSSTSNSDDTILRDSTYYLTVYDDTRGELGGPYFTIREVKSQTKTLSTFDTYEVDVGFPSDNLVTKFSIQDDNSWALLYNYASEINKQQHVYSIDESGRIVTKYSPNITTSTKGFITTEAQKTWWTKMTQFPITATLEIKGLLRPSMLMSYVRVNAMFYGQRHISSGLYIITKQIDDISKGGYRTTLTLVRIGGDNDVMSTVTKTVTTKKPVITVAKAGGKGSTTHVSSSGKTHGGGGGSF